MCRWPPAHKRLQMMSTKQPYFLVGRATPPPQSIKLLPLNIVHETSTPCLRTPNISLSTAVDTSEREPSSMRVFFFLTVEKNEKTKIKKNSRCAECRELPPCFDGCVLAWWMLATYRLHSLRAWALDFHAGAVGCFRHFNLKMVDYCCNCGASQGASHFELHTHRILWTHTQQPAQRQRKLLL